MSVLQSRVGWPLALLLAMIACDVAAARAQSLPETIRRLIETQPESMRQRILNELGRAPQAPQAPQAPRLESHATVVLDFAAGAPSASRMLAQLRAGNPYHLDDSGFLHLPGILPIRLAGLDVAQANVRLRAEPALAGLQVSLTLLPLDPVGVDALEKFGYDFFRNARRSEHIAVSVPVDYIIGPGDNIELNLFGNRNARYQLTVNRDGVINFPEIGTVSVAGLSLESLRREVALRVAEQLIGVRVSATLGPLRSINIFVLGDAELPGRHLVSGFSTVVNALLAARGVKEAGSLRRIEVKRDGRVVSRLDLYDFLLHGDTRGDMRVRQGDVIFVPPVGDTVAVYGEVKRPAIYEVRGEATVADMIALAGGRLATASAAGVRVTRVEPHGSSVREVGWDGVGREVMRSGDIVQVPVKLDKLHRSVRLSGHVQNAGLYGWLPGMWLTDLLPDAAALKPRADLRYLLLRREIQPNARIELLSPNLEAAWRNPRTAADVTLLPRDTVYVLRRGVPREEIVRSLIERDRVASVEGGVRIQGTYPFVKGMRVSDLIRASGGLRRIAYRGEAELLRYSLVGNERLWNTISVDLAGVLAGDPAADIPIEPLDRLHVKRRSAVERRSVTVSGRVRFPGIYSISRNERLSRLLQRAGGITDDGFAQGAIFLRTELQRREQENIQQIANRFETELATVALGSEEGTERLATGQALLNRLRNTHATGRLVIDLPGILAGDSEKDVVLQAGDHLLVPEIPQEVSVTGEVQRAASYLYDPDLDRDDYIRLSGGMTDRADVSRIYVLRASGGVLAENSASRFFYRSNVTQVIRPGDSIIVPLDAEYVEPVRVWTLAAQLLQSLAVTAAAVNSIVD